MVIRIFIIAVKRGKIKEKLGTVSIFFKKIETVPDSNAYKIAGKSGFFALRFL